MNRLTTALVCCAAIGYAGWAPAMAQFARCNVSLYSWLDLPAFPNAPGGGNSCWGYVSPSGEEYALMGLENQIAVVRITNPADPVIVGSISHTGSLWADVKVYGHHAYACNESGGGLDVIDLSQVDEDEVSLVRRVTQNGLQSSHTIAVNEASGYLYLAGSNLNGGRLVAMSLADPANPSIVGQWNSSQGGVYVHEAHVLSYASGPYAGKEIAFCFDGGSGMRVVDVTNKSNIVSFSPPVTYPGLRYCHQGWTGEDRQYLYMDDELDDGTQPSPRTIIIDISNLAAPAFVGVFGSGARATDHNLYYHQGFIYESNYKSGLRVFDAANPVVPVEVGYFDTFPENDTTGYNGTWSNYPYFPSGTVIVSDMARGLFILDVSDAHQGRLSFSFPQGQPATVDPAGSTRMRVDVAAVGSATPEPDTGMLFVDRGEGFAGVPMEPVASDAYDAEFPLSICGQELFYYVSAETAAAAVRSDPCDAPGHVYRAFSASGTIVFFADDFETVQSWTTGPDTASAGFWIVGNPNGTDNQPENDHTPNAAINCIFTAQNFVAQNGFGDVDGGTVVATSSLFDLSTGDAVLTYYRWYAESYVDDDPEDGFLAEISNDDGASWTTIESLSTGFGGWQEVRLTISDLLPPTGLMRMRFSATDGTLAGDFIEAAIDDIVVERLLCNAQDADIDNDGDADLADYAVLQGCFTGPGPCTCIPTLYDQSGRPECIASDLDLDGDVDLPDHDLYNAGLTGS